MDISLQEISAAREARVLRQQRLLSKYGTPLVCFTMNIPGPTKDSPLLRRAFEAGLSMLESRLCVVWRDISYAATGCEGYFAVNGNAADIKAICVGIEESCPMGRLFDMDVLDIDGKKLERKTERSCMVCGKPGRYCAASRAHDVATLQSVTCRLITDHFSAADAAHIADLAVQALLDEVHTTPKPGLVDETNCGSHKDMDIPLFTASAHALRPYFLQCVLIGQQTAQQPETTFSALRQAGLEAEKQMFAATGGVNTHKGAIYTLGILCGAAGRLWKADAPFAPAEQILQEAGHIAAPSAKADLAAITAPKTPGERLYQTLGIAGIRGEAALGFPSVANISLPIYRQLLDTKSKNDAAAITLLHLIAGVDDTNLYHRGGKAGAEFAKNAAAALLPDPTAAQIAELDRCFIERNLSPGGCADLLAATLFIASLRSV